MKTYQVALSFAGEQRDYVERVARMLKSKGVSVFYDTFETASSWGKDGTEFFHRVFALESSFVVMFVSEDYVRKEWTRHERRSALSEALKRDTEYVLPVRFDETPVPGLPSTVIYVTAAKYGPESLAILVCEKLGVPTLLGKASDAPPPQTSAVSGQVAFTYKSFKGRYVIGSGPLSFETMWTEAGPENVHVYTYPESIRGVAIAPDATSITDVHDASSYNFTSASRTPREGQVVILQNTNGFYAALKITSIKDGGVDDLDAELRFDYAIQADGSGSFR